jgi:[ribosomal protein S5]-alanine N-acetyltransferase
MWCLGRFCRLEEGPLMESLSTDRLKLIPSSLSVERAILQQRDMLPSITGLRVPEAWPGDDWLQALASLIDVYEEHPKWCGWNRNISHARDATLIGGIGCVCPPGSDGAVSIGFHIVPEYRRQGYALEAAQAYTEWLSSQHGVRLITADCLITNAASIRILEHLRMTKVGEFEDEEGHKLRWEIDLSRP